MTRPLSRNLRLGNNYSPACLDGGAGLKTSYQLAYVVGEPTLEESAGSDAQPQQHCYPAALFAVDQRCQLSLPGLEWHQGPCCLLSASCATHLQPR